MTMNEKYSDYVVYVDESGDHGLSSIDSEYPIFVLAFCIFKKDNYLQTVNKVQNFKFKHFGHDIVILHESEIRKNRGAFQILHSKELKQTFMNELTGVIEEENFTVVSAVINKSKLNKQYVNAGNPYHLAMGFCLERLHQYLSGKGSSEDLTTHIVFEQRGGKMNGGREDKELELEFRRVCNGNNYFNKKMNFDIVIANKQCNSTGLQLADLIARPIGMNYLRPGQENKAFEIIEKKPRKHNGEYKGFGLKIFP